MKYWVIGVVVFAATGCGATLEQLANRATFETGCLKQELEIQEIDGRTMGVTCRGKKYIYVENCGRVNPDGSKTDCTWVLDK